MSLISSVFKSIPSSLRPILDEVAQTAEGQYLMQRIQNQWDVVFDERAQFAECLWGKKVIRIHPNLLEDRAQLKSYLIFEMCNAARAREFSAIRAKNVEDYVEQFERIEHASYLETSKIFPNLGFTSFTDFSDHYLWQQLNGHSHRVALGNYPQETYRGMLQALSDRERQVLEGCLKSKWAQNPEWFQKFFALLPSKFRDLITY